MDHSMGNEYLYCSFSPTASVLKPRCGSLSPILTSSPASARTHRSSAGPVGCWRGARDLVCMQPVEARRGYQTSSRSGGPAAAQWGRSKLVYLVSRSSARALIVFPFLISLYLMSPSSV